MAELFSRITANGFSANPIRTLINAVFRAKMFLNCSLPTTTYNTHAT